MKIKNNLPRLKILVGDAEFSASLSPSDSLMLYTEMGSAEDDSDWGSIETFSIGDKVLTERDRAYTVIGFTMANTLICVPYGLGHDPAIRFVELQSLGLRFLQ